MSSRTRKTHAAGACSGSPVVTACHQPAPDFYGSIMKYDLTIWGLGLAGAWMLAGNIFMYKMCNFRI